MQRVQFALTEVPGHSIQPAHDDLKAAIQVIGNHPLTKAMLDAFSGAVMILNTHGQIIAANMGFLSQAAGLGSSEILGKRIGEVVQCTNAAKSPGGCGTSPGCNRCGVLGAIRASDDGKAVERECNIRLTPSRELPHAFLELKVRASRVQIGEHDCTVLAFQDISDRKRRQALERIFFHDVLNTTTALASASSLLENNPVLADKLSGRIARLSKRLIREITQERDGAWRPGEIRFRAVPVKELFSELEQHFGAIEIESGPVLKIRPDHQERSLITDRTLLLRILTNMVKNAFEASRQGDEVRVWCEPEEGGLSFKVWNTEPIAPEIADRIFEKNFSTKATAGRGLGTYSMKLLGEVCLGGRVGFETSSEGTVFFVTLSSDTAQGSFAVEWGQNGFR